MPISSSILNQQSVIKTFKFKINTQATDLCSVLSFSVQTHRRARCCCVMLSCLAVASPHWVSVWLLLHREQRPKCSFHTNPMGWHHRMSGQQDNGCCITGSCVPSLVLKSALVTDIESNKRVTMAVSLQLMSHRWLLCFSSSCDLWLLMCQCLGLVTAVVMIFGAVKLSQCWPLGTPELQCVATVCVVAPTVVHQQIWHCCMRGSSKETAAQNQLRFPCRINRHTNWPGRIFGMCLKKPGHLQSSENEETAPKKIQKIALQRFLLKTPSYLFENPKCSEPRNRTVSQ